MKVVLDASALLAFLHNERGADIVDPMVPEAAMCSVNWSEVVQKATARGVDVRGLRNDVEALGLRIVPFSASHAEQTAALWSHTHTAGLSLGDRACLALGHAFGLPILTADRVWSQLDLDVDVRMIR